MEKIINIAIDGPAGAGKSTIAKNLSKMLNILYLDTGAMYRAFALKIIEEGIDTLDVKNIENMIEKVDIDIIYDDNRQQRVMLNDRDVTGLIRTPEISKGASDVSAVPAVRIKLVELQRKIAEKSSVVMDGRDIGTYVLPNAHLKIYLTASVDERAKRRFTEMESAGNKANNVDLPKLEDIKKDIEYRDKNDSEREFAPLKKADDAVLVDTTELTIEQSMEKIVKLAEEIKR